MKNYFLISGCILCAAAFPASSEIGAIVGAGMMITGALLYIASKESLVAPPGTVLTQFNQEKQ